MNPLADNGVCTGYRKGKLYSRSEAGLIMQIYLLRCGEKELRGY